MVNYPNGTSGQSVPKNVNYARRGMSLESDLNDTNKYYLAINKAAIYKKPTPITITKVEYKSRATAKITEAFFQIPSTTDYNGVYKSHYIDFEAKETHSETSMSLQIIHPHQLAHLGKVIEFGGIAFVIIRFTKFDETYLLMAEKLLDFIKNNERKSVPYLWIKQEGYLIDYNYAIKVDYLKVIDSILEGK